MTLAFEQANTYARASGYVVKRYVDFSDHVKAEQVLAEITAPELEDQAAQFRTAAAGRSNARQTEAQRALAQVTRMSSSVLTKEG